MWPTCTSGCFARAHRVKQIPEVVVSWPCNKRNVKFSIFLRFPHLEYPPPPMLHLLFCIPVLLTQYCSTDKMKKNGMGGTRSAYGGEERRVQDFGWEI